MKNKLKMTFALSALIPLVMCFFSCVSDDVELLKTVDTSDAVIFKVTEEESILKPEAFYENSKNTADIYIKTDNPKANIYLNGNYQGRSPLRITDLVPGYYSLMVEFSQASSEFNIHKYMIELEMGKENVYYIEK